MPIWKNEPKRKVTFQYAAIVAAVVFAANLDMAGVSLPKIAMNAYQNMASLASLNASVPPNPYNALAQEFQARDQELSAREQALLAERAELDARYERMITANKRLTLIVLGGVTFCLLLLILLNFYFDVRREEEHERKTPEEPHGEMTTKL